MCLAAAVVAVGAPSAQAQEHGGPLAAGADSAVAAGMSRVAHAVGVGGAGVLDTYLSQEHFSGFGMTFLSDAVRFRPGRRWRFNIQHQANFSSVADRRDDVKMAEGAYNFYWSPERSWQMQGGRLALTAGCAVNAGIGFIWNPGGGNNPANARLHLNIMPTVAADWGFTLWGMRLTAGYRAHLPLVGLMFSPNYGQSYYEIFQRGDYDHNLVPTTFVAAPNFRQALSVDIGLGRTAALRVGYLGDYRQAAVNNLKQHVYSHYFMIGLVRRFKLIRYRP